MILAAKTRSFRFIILWLFTLSVFSCVFASKDSGAQTITAELPAAGTDIQTAADENSGNGPELQTITVQYSGAEKENQSITINYADEWLLQPDDIYNHNLMQASFALAASGFRDKTKDLDEMDVNILDFFNQAGYIEPRTIDFDVIPSISTIGTAIAYKPVGDATVIAVSISGNNYQGEWAGNLTIDDDNRVKGFNDAADKVMERLNQYIRDHDLHGDLRLWTAGYSRSAAVTNDFAADAVDSGLFQAVYAYTFATPRTTREKAPGQYHNIFNMLNPFDMVPMSPFPEWGFERYGIDLFFPSIETNSQWLILQGNALEIFDSVSDEEIIINPQINKNLHMLFDYLAFFISSANSYKTNVQSPLVEYIESRNLRTLLQDMSKLISMDTVREYLLRRNEIARYQMHEVYGFLDFLTQNIYTSLIGRINNNAANIYWDPDASTQENLAFNHYDKTYRSWLFSTDDYEALLSREAKYAHVVIRGDVDVDVFDENGDFIIHINNEYGSGSFDKADIRMPSFTGGFSDTFIYFERQEGQTLLILPLDQVFSVGIYSHKGQVIRVSYAEFSAEKLRAAIRYIYEDEYDAGEYYLEVFDPEKESEYTTEDLLDMGVLVVEPWSRDIVYSPTAVMRLENEGIPHPSPRLLLAVILLILIIILFILIRILIAIIRLIKIIPKKLTRRSASPGE